MNWDICRQRREHTLNIQEGRGHNEVSPGGRGRGAPWGGLSKPRRLAAETGESDPLYATGMQAPGSASTGHFLSVEAAAESSGSRNSTERGPSAARGCEAQVGPRHSCVEQAGLRCSCVKRWQCSMTAGGESLGQDPLLYTTSVSSELSVSVLPSGSQETQTQNL